MRKPVTLITGANGEMGHGLISHLTGQGRTDIVAVDLRPIDPGLADSCQASLTGDILDQGLLQRLVSEFEIRTIYHLAALLSTRSEYAPDTAHEVNVTGTLNLLKLAHEQARWHGHRVKFLFPSSIAVYGFRDPATKHETGKVREHQWTVPCTMYGCNKLYCEQLGRYYSRHFRQLAAEREPSRIDFRCIRFPGIISAVTLPTGGTSDYAPEMLHAAAQGLPYECFVGEKAIIPFMVMPDAIKALTMLGDASDDHVDRSVYNVTAFSLTAADIRDRVVRAFPGAEVTFKPDAARAKIVDSWPADVDDSAAREEWGWVPDFEVDRAFDDYLVPMISKYYRER